MKKECNNKEFVFDTDDLKIERKNKMYLSNNEIKTPQTQYLLCSYFLKSYIVKFNYYFT